MKALRKKRKLILFESNYRRNYCHYWLIRNSSEARKVWLLRVNNSNLFAVNKQKLSGRRCGWRLSSLGTMKWKSEFPFIDKWRTINSDKIGKSRRWGELVEGVHNLRLKTLLMLICLMQLIPADVSNELSFACWFHSSIISFVDFTVII